tara:strand:- start:335 stop:610 length:276 start_codon:yes stop_codon:yes gene_type:complete
MFDPELFAISRRVNKAIEETHKRSMALPKKPVVKKTKPVEIPTPPRRVKNNTFLDLAQKGREFDKKIESSKKPEYDDLLNFWKTSKEMEKI